MTPKEEKGKKFLACKCGYTNKKAKSEMREEVAGQEEIRVVDSDDSPNLIVDAMCSECGPVKAEHWAIQTRASDEPETQFFKCKKCSKTWKE
jgi:DNA-directed RNA polymerase subunit M